MMLNEIIGITSSGAKFPGIVKSQPLTDGDFVGLCQFTDDIEPQQINFKSVLSKIGSGNGQVSPEESNNANLNLAEGQIPAEAQEDKAVAGKPKGKKEKDGGVVKRPQSGYPKAHVIVMGLLAMPDPPQSDLPADFAFHVPGPESEEETASVHAAADRDSAVQVGGIMGDPGLRVGPSPAVRESMPTDQNDDSDIPPQIVKVKSASFYSARDSAETGGAAATSAGALNADNNEAPNMFMAAIQAGKNAGREEGSDFQPAELESAASNVDFTRENHPEKALLGSRSTQEFRSEIPIFNTSKNQLRNSAVREPVPRYPEDTQETESQFIKVKSASVYPAGDAAETGKTFQASDGALNADNNDAPKMFTAANHQERIAGEKAGSDFQSAELESAASNVDFTRENHPEKALLGSRSTQEFRSGIPIFNASENLLRNAAVREPVSRYPADTPEIGSQFIKVKPAAVYPAGDAAETGKTVPVSDGALNADNNDAPNMFMAANHLGRIAGGKDSSDFQPADLEPAASAVNFVRENHTETVMRVSESPKEFRPEGQSFHTEVLKQITEKTSSGLKSGQSEIRIDLKPESLGHLRIHVLTDHQQVTVKILAENPRVKEMIENQASLIKNELQNQGIHVNTVKVDMLMSGGSDFAYSQHENTAFRQDGQEPAYGSGKDDVGVAESKEPDSLDMTGNMGRSSVNYFA
jgi:hypothetical protein